MDRFEDAFHRLDACLTRRMRVFRTPALALALTDRDATLRCSAHGFADLEQRIPLTPDHLFAIGSIGKSFTAIAILQAHQEGLIELRAPVRDYLPWFEVKSIYQPITIHHLLTHTSGLPRGTDFSPDPRAEVFALRDFEPGFAPGAHFYYSDLGYKVLGLALEAVTGKRYAENIRTRILEPLGMDNTFAETIHTLRPRSAAGCRGLYDDRPLTSRHPLVPADWVETDSGDGCILSTAEDMARYARMILNEGRLPDGTQLLNESGFRRLVFPMVEEDGEAYSYGLYLFDDDGYRHVGHGGDVPGYESYMWMDLDNGLGTVVLMTTPYTPRASFIALELFREAYLGNRLPDPPPMPDFTYISDPKEYVGIYHAAEHGSLRIEADGHHLVLVLDRARVILEERSPGRFIIDHPDWDRFPLCFSREADGKVCEAFYGPRWYMGERYSGPINFVTPPEWSAYAGHYRSHDPWLTNFRVFTRKGQLLLAAPDGEEETLVWLGDGRFRIGEESYIPEQIVFDQIVEGQALRATRSSCAYYRFFTP